MPELKLQNPPVSPPETSAPPPSSNAARPVMFRANAAGVPDTSLSLGVPLQQPMRWSHDWDSETALSRAWIKAETPLFEQVPQAPTPPQGDSSASLATTEWVHQQGAGLIEEAVIKGRIGSDGRFPAAPGDIGEYISAFRAAPGLELTTSTITVIASIELTPGDWDIQAQIAFNNTGIISNPPNVFYAGAISDGPSWPGFQDAGGAVAISCQPINDVALSGMYQRQLIGVPQTFFVLGYAQFPNPPRVYCYAYISARRRR